MSTVRPRPANRWTTVLPVLGLLLCGCRSEPATGLRVIAIFSTDLAPDQLAIAINSAQTTPQSTRVPPQPQRLQSPARALVLLQSPLEDTRLTVTVDGLASESLVARGQGSALLRAGLITDVIVELSAPCSDRCPPGDQQCVGNSTRHCMRTAQGCFDWTIAEPCPQERPYCTATTGVCETSCVDECQPDERRCVVGDATRFTRCGEFDGDPCRDFSAPTSCGAQETCRPSDGACVLLCDGKPCSCQANQTQPCADQGRCKGGERKCENGTFGACVWQQGPSAEVCNGVDDDCDTHTDESEDLVAEPCAEQRGVCQGSTKRCGGTSGWLPCTAGDLSAHAKAQGFVYESDETRCDGFDNDCDGQVDEHPNCCTPQCAGKHCGADDGCGNPCTAGSCPSQASCKGGVCSCDFVSCGGACCAASEQCIGGSCCAPNCAGKSCGADDGCGRPCATGSCQTNARCVAGGCVCDGVSCGSSCCGVGETCNAGACCKPDCSGKSCGADDGCGGKCQSGSCPLNASCQAGSCRCDFIACAGACCQSGEVCQGQCRTQCTTLATVVDDAGDVGSAPSLAFDSKGKPHISYRDTTNGDLKYATLDSAKRWTTSIIDSQYDTGDYSSLAIDKNNKLHISYFAWSGRSLRYATNSLGAWWKEYVEQTGDVGRTSALTVDKQLGVHIAYTDNTNNDLRYASLSAGSTKWTISAIDQQGSVGFGPSLAVDSQGKVHISYEDETNGDLKYATNVSGQWVAIAIDTQGIVGQYSTLALDGQGKIHIAYFDDSHDDLKYITNASGSWVAQVVDSPNTVGGAPSLAIDAQGKAHISYYDFTNGDLRYATNASGSWVAFTVDQQGDVGWRSSLALDAQQRPNIAYRDESNRRLKYLVICP
ncbi:MAG: hypothetical protein H6707_21630 [Deltaproteobacteria bacterium]|nr:hypothetical protein [Deltaproteobacteria bacterium]